MTTSPGVKCGDVLKGTIVQVLLAYAYVHVPGLEGYSIAILMKEYTAMKNMRRQQMRFTAIQRARLPIDIHVVRVDEERKVIDASYPFDALIHDFVKARDVLRASA